MLRGLHFQKTKPQGKLVQVVSGKVFDVAVDIRKESSSYGKWFGIELSGENHKQFWIPLALLTVSWCCQNSHYSNISVLNIITQKMKVALSGMIKICRLVGL